MFIVFEKKLESNKLKQISIDMGNDTRSKLFIDLLKGTGEYDESELFYSEIMEEI